jgi:hypothetical protein
MHKNTIIVAGVALAALFSSAAYADPLISLGGLEIGSASTVGNPVGLPEVTNVVTEAIGGMTGGSVGVPGVAEVTTSGSNPITTRLPFSGAAARPSTGASAACSGSRARTSPSTCRAPTASACRDFPAFRAYRSRSR